MINELFNYFVLNKKIENNKTKVYSFYYIVFNNEYEVIKLEEYNTIYIEEKYVLSTYLFLQYIEKNDKELFNMIHLKGNISSVYLFLIKPHRYKFILDKIIDYNNLYPNIRKRTELLSFIEYRSVFYPHLIVPKDLC